MFKRLGITLVGVAMAIGVSAPAAVANPMQTTSHVPTWAMDDGCNGGTGASAGFVRSWLTFAESDCGPDARKPLRDCHAGGHTYCYVMQYMDSDWNYADSALPLSDQSSNWVHTPNGSNRIYSSDEGGGYLINQANPSVRAFFRSYVRANYNADDGLLMDEQAPGLGEELYYSNCGCSRTLEIPSNRALQKAHEEMSAAMTHSNGTPFMQVDNSIAPNPFLPQGFGMLSPKRGVVGLMAEGEPEAFGQLDPYYSTLLDQMAYVLHRTSGFVVPMSYGSPGASYEEQSRNVQEATVLLAFTPRRVVDAADLEQGSNDLEVWPEEGIYPTAPMQTMGAPTGRGCLNGNGGSCTRGGHRSLQVAPGVYRREFGACYDRGVLFGACAAIVNTTGNWVTVSGRWVTRSLRNQITFNGGDVQSGGTLSLRGAPFAAGRTLIAPDDAVLLSQ
jgi:hypothetical protein